MKKIAEILVFLKGESKKFTSSRPSHLESQVVENKRTWLFYARGTISSANSPANRISNKMNILALRGARE